MRLIFRERFVIELKIFKLITQTSAVARNSVKKILFWPENRLPQTIYVSGLILFNGAGLFYLELYVRNKLFRV